MAITLWKMEPDLTLEDIVGIIITTIVGVGVGYAIQQNREALEIVQNGQLAAFVLANVVKSGTRDIYCRIQGQNANQIVWGDLKNAIVFNVNIAVGYGVGFLKDFL